MSDEPVVSYARPLKEKLKPLDQAIESLRNATAQGGQPEVLVALEAINDVLNELVKNKWTGGVS